MALVDARDRIVWVWGDMWQVLTLPKGGEIVSTSLSESMTLMFARPRGAPVFINMYSDIAEPRIFDKARLPILTVDGEHVFDLNESMELQKLMTDLNELNEVHCFAEDRSVGARIWSGEEISPTAFILKMMKGENLHVRVFLNPFAMAEYNVSATVPVVWTASGEE